MIGGGKQFEAMARAVKAHGLEDAFRFQTYQDRAMLPYSLTVSDVHWLSLDPRLEGLIVPSKFYGIAAAGRLIVMIGDEQGGNRAARAAASLRCCDHAG
jgi:colanic acid biosynthesis glycosyl transferase WcaI